MANTTINPAQGQLLVNIEDMSMLKDIKKAISMVKGVGKITNKRDKCYSAYELSLRDLDEGRVTTQESVDDYFKKFGL
ncbi:MAG: hypothetical protein IJ587_10640 [Synergistaceae bacterium]|nr:hypothetical protein [Synergistaceae bacterium]